MTNRTSLTAYEREHLDEFYTNLALEFENGQFPPGDAVDVTVWPDRFLK